MGAPREIDGATRLVLVSERRLVGQAVAGALAARHLHPVLFDWPDRKSRAAMLRRRIVVSGASVGLVLSDLATPDRVRDVELLVTPPGVPWLVLTGSDPGPRWGLVLEVGAAGVLATSTNIEEITALLHAAAGGHDVMAPKIRDQVRRQWAQVASEQRELVWRLEQLTPREARVLEMLYDGMSVTHIATVSEVSVATVRSQVKALRRKLGVDSQLAAVAMYRRALEFFPRDRMDS